MFIKRCEYHVNVTFVCVNTNLPVGSIVKNIISIYINFHNTGSPEQKLLLEVVMHVFARNYLLFHFWFRYISCDSFISGHCKITARYIVLGPSMSTSRLLF